MIILLGGVSSTGKTFMAQRLLQKYHIPYLSIDHLKMGLIRGIDNFGITPTDGDERIAYKLWPILKGILMTNIENDQNMIVEGCYLLPDLVKDFFKENETQLIPVYIGFSEDYIKKNFVSRILKYRCIIERRKYVEERTMNQVIDEHHALKKACKLNDLPYFEINEDYEEEIKVVYQWIDDKYSANDDGLK